MCITRACLFRKWVATDTQKHSRLVFRPNDLIESAARSECGADASARSNVPMPSILRKHYSTIPLPLMIKATKARSLKPFAGALRDERSRCLLECGRLPRKFYGQWGKMRMQSSSAVWSKVQETDLDE